MRISCPPTISPCFYGVDTPRRSELIAATHTLDEIRRYLDADSVAYLSLDGLTGSVRGGSHEVLHVVLHGRLSGGVPARRGRLSPAGAQAEPRRQRPADPAPVPERRTGRGAATALAAAAARPVRVEPAGTSHGLQGVRRRHRRRQRDRSADSRAGALDVHVGRAVGHRVVRRAVSPRAGPVPRSRCSCRAPTASAPS